MQHEECKLCPRCGIWKNKVIDFHKDKQKKDGIHPICKKCKYNNPVNRIPEPESKVCIRCNIEKPINKFGKLKSRCDGRHSVCMFCNAPHRNKEGNLYKRGKEKIKLRNRRVRKENKQILINLLGGQCHDCGLKPSEEWPLACFDFHHLEDKNFLFAKFISNSTMIEELKSEAQKCKILCANCHRRFHVNNGYKRKP